MLSSRFVLHHVPVSTVADDERVARLLREALLYKRARLIAEDESSDEVGGADPSAGLRFDFRIGRSEQVPDGMRLVGTTPNGITIYFDGFSHVLQGANGSVHLDTERGHTRGVLSPSLFGPSRDLQENAEPFPTAPEAYALVIMSLTLLLRARGFLGLHAAALANDAQSVLISAPSGHGKSTTAFLLLRSGWAPISDDAVLLHDSGHDVEALSYRRAFLIGRDAAQHFPELNRAPNGSPPWPPAPTDPAKWRVDVEQAYSRPGSLRCTPTTLLLPTLTGEATTRVEPVGLQEAFFALVEQSVISVPMPPGTGQDLIDLLQRLVHQVQAYRLYAGRDLLEDPRRAADLIGSLHPALV